MQKQKVDTYWVRIYMAGDIQTAKRECAEFCYLQGLCVTVAPADYIYTGGQEAGFMVELINYPRFPSTPDIIWNTAFQLAANIRAACCQHSVLLMDPDKTEWISVRDECKAAAK